MEQEQATASVTANEFVENELHVRLAKIESLFGAHGLSLNGPIVDGVDDFLRASIEKRSSRDRNCKKLVVVLTTEGGYLETVQRIVETMRKHYDVVDFVIPNHAFSAGTILAMSGDAIFMDYYSRLGPIDPQVETQSGGRSVSALGYLERYNALLKRAQNPRLRISPAEVNLLLSFDQGELYLYEQAREQSIDLLKQWLVRYKFKNWTVTQSRKKKVTSAMKENRAKEIGKKLNDSSKWHSHGHGISMEVLRRDLNLLIDDFEANSAICGAIRGYHNLLSDYMMKRGSNGAIHVVDDYRSFM